MEIFFKPTFLKDLKKLPKNIQLEIKNICFEIFPKIKNLNELNLDIKQLKGFKNFYRIKIGNYRLGFKKENNNIIFMRVKHRKDIYKLFP